MIKGCFLWESLIQLKKIFQILSRSENLNLTPKTVDNLFKFLLTIVIWIFFELLQTFCQKATFSCMIYWFCFISTYLYWPPKMYFECLLLVHGTVTLKIAKFRFSWFWCLKSTGPLHLNVIRNIVFILQQFFDGSNFWNTLFSKIVPKIFCLYIQG